MAQVGWIKLHRKLLEWEWYEDLATRSVFLHLLLVAEFEQCKRKGRVIERGQAAVTVADLSRILGLSTQQTRTALSNIRTTNEITIETTNQFSLITIVNYDTYQSDELPNNKPNNKPKSSKLTNEQQTNQQTLILKKENKKERKEEEDTSCAEPNKIRSTPTDTTPVFITLELNDDSEFPITESIIAKFAPLFPAVDLREQFRKMSSWCITHKAERKTKRGIMKFVNSWLSREQDRAKFTSNGGNHANNNGANTPRFGERVEPTIEQLKSDTERRKAINEQFQRRRLADGTLQLTGNGAGN